jgi:hypothetical protein
MIYRSKTHPVLKRNSEVLSACDWLAALTAHIPNAGEHLVQYYDWYSNVSRRERRKAAEYYRPRETRSTHKRASPVTASCLSGPVQVNRDLPASQSLGQISCGWQSAKWRALEPHCIARSA